MAESVLAPVVCVDSSRIQEVERRLLDMVRRRPGIQVTDAAGQVRQEVAVRERVAFSVVRALERQGGLQRRTWRRRGYLFPPCRDLDAWWMQLVALRDEDLRCFFALIAESQRLRSDVCREVQQRFGWQESVTRKRIRRLQEAGLVLPCEVGKRDPVLRACTPHPSARDALNQSQTNWLASIGPMGSQT